MSLKLLEAKEESDYLEATQYQDNVNVGTNVLSWVGGGTAETLRFEELYYDRFDQVYQNQVNANPSRSLVAHDPLTLDNSGAGLRFISNTATSTNFFVGEWDRLLNTQSLYVAATQFNNPFREHDPSSFNELDSDVWPDVGSTVTRSGVSSGTQGYYGGAGSGVNSPAGAWVFFEELGVGIHTNSFMRDNGVNKTNVLVEVDLSTGLATLIDIPIFYTTAPEEWENPEFNGATFALSAMQFVPDDDSIPSAPKGRLVFHSLDNLTDPNDSQLKNIYVAIYEWNPTGVTGGNPTRIHKRQTLLSRLQLKENASVTDGGIGNGSWSGTPGIFHPGTSSLRFFFRHGSFSSPAPDDALTMVVYSITAEVSDMSAPTAQRRVETNRNVDFSTTVTGDLGERIAGETVEFTLERVSTKDELIGIGDGTSGDTSGDFSLVNAPIDLISDVTSITVAAVSYTPIATGTASSGLEVEVDLTNGDLQFFSAGTPTNVTGTILGTYRHFSTPATPPFGNLLTGATRSDETGRASAVVRYEDDPTDVGEYDQLSAETV